MGTTVIPVYCPHCRALFASRAFRNMGNAKGLRLAGNMESCPRCGQLARVAVGVFDIANSVISVVSAPNVTKQMLLAFEAAVQKAYAQKMTPENLAEQVGKIDPSFGEIVRKVGTNVVGLLILLAAIKSCSVDIKLDANRLIDQLTNAPPAAEVSENPNEN